MQHPNWPHGKRKNIHLTKVTLDAVRRFLNGFLPANIWITPADLGDCRIRGWINTPDLVRETVELIPGSRFELIRRGAFALR